MKRTTQEFILLVLVIIFIVGCGFTVIHCLNSDNITVVGWERYIVQPGDTLWTIMPDSRYDVRDLMDITKEHNNLDSSKLFIGQIIEIPVVEE